MRKKIALIVQTFELIFTFFSLSPKIDLIFTSGSGWFPSLIAWLGFLSRKPVVKEIVLLGSDDPQTLHQEKKFWLRWFFLLPFRFAKLIVTISPSLESACLSLGISREKIWCRLNPVNFEIDEDMLKLARKKNSGRPILLWVGAITPRKNVVFLLKSARHLIVPAEIWIVGPSYDKKYFNEVLEAKNEVPSFIDVKFWGHIEKTNELAKLYAQANLFLFASKNEGMGNVVAEALVCGTPVVTLPVMGIMSQVIPTSEDGEIVDTENPEEFALAIMRWLEKKPDRAAISNRARLRFDTEAVDNQYIAHFEKIAGLNFPIQNLNLDPKPKSAGKAAAAVSGNA